MKPGLRPEFVFTEDSEPRLLGVNLSSDHCSEHEWGIADIRSDFDCDDTPTVFGLARRQIRRLPEALRWWIWKDGTVGFGTFWRYEDKVDLRRFPYGLDSVTPKRPLVAAWDEREFGVRSASSEEGKLREIWEAFQRLDVAIWRYGGGPFGGGGLLIAIASRLPEEGMRQLAEADRERWELQEYRRATGIEATLKAAGLNWYALSPRREGTEVKWWLNPADQRKYNHGWYTLADLVAWANGTGPVVRTVKR